METHYIYVKTQIEKNHVKEKKNSL